MVETPSLEIALFNGQKELTAPWYVRSNYPADLGWWHQIADNRLRSKLPVVFPAATEAEFLDYRASRNDRYAFNGWCLYNPTATSNAIFYGAFGDRRGVVLDKSVSVDFYLEIDLSECAVQARYAAWSALFGMPQQQGYAGALASLCERAYAEKSRAPTALIYGPPG